jgi:AcrR family transcriptional regulator
MVYTAAMPGLLDEKKALTRRAICNAAVRLMAARGFERTTMDEIADAARVGRRTVFRYFPTKEAIFVGSLPGDRELKQLFRERRPEEDDVDFVVRVLEGIRARAFDIFDPRYRRSARRIVRKVPSIAVQTALTATRVREAAARAMLGDRSGAKQRLRACLLASAAIMAVDIARTTWVEGGERGAFTVVLEEAKALLKAGCGDEPRLQRAAARSASGSTTSSVSRSSWRSRDS